MEYVDYVVLKLCRKIKLRLNYWIPTNYSAKVAAKSSKIGGETASIKMCYDRYIQTNRSTDLRVGFYHNFFPKLR